MDPPHTPVLIGFPGSPRRRDVHRVHLVVSPTGADTGSQRPRNGIVHHVLALGADQDDPAVGKDDLGTRPGVAACGRRDQGWQAWAWARARPSRRSPPASRASPGPRVLLLLLGPGLGLVHKVG